MEVSRRLPVVAALAALVLLLALYAVQLVAHPFGEAGGMFEKVATNVVFLGSGLLCVLRAALVRGERWVWACFGAGLLAWGLGNLYFTLALWDLEEIPFPSLADAGYVLFYPAMFAGLALLLRARVAAVGHTVWVDGLTAALTVAGLAAAIVFPAVRAETGGSLATVAVNLAYPLGDLILLSLVVGALSVSRVRGAGAWLLIAGGLLAFAITDTLFLYGNAEGTYHPGAWFDLGWPLCALAVAAVAWRPATAVRPKPAEGWLTIVPPIGFAALSLVVLVIDHFDRTGLAALFLATAAILAVFVRLVMTFAENRAMLAASRRDATTDALTGLLNRRALMRDLDRRLPRTTTEAPITLALFDLDGFKLYNDNFGHPAGDSLLVRLAARLREALAGRATAYRMGGDEFCVLVEDEVASAHDVIARAAAALSEHGEGFAVGCSHGAVVLPDDARTASDALRLADQRMYAHKSRGRTSAGRQSTDVLLRALGERHPELHQHLSDVAVMAGEVAARLGLGAREQELTRLAAELHDVGKVAIPDQILEKPGPLTGQEWAFMRRHTEIGARIIEAAPALAEVAPIVRSTHERWDGGGYPDGLAGEQVPLEARIVAVCDAYDAMRSRRAYKEPLSEAEALSELERCAGTQFDPRVVEAFVTVARRRLGRPAAA